MLIVPCLSILYISIEMSLLKVAVFFLFIILQQANRNRSNPKAPYTYTISLFMKRTWWSLLLIEVRRVSSGVEHSSANPKVPGSILGPVSYRGHGL